MTRRLLLMIVVLGLLLTINLTATSLTFSMNGAEQIAQNQGTTDFNPNANISFPPPVYVVRGRFEIRGTANLPNMSNYFIEFRRLADDLSVPNASAPWTPATLPTRAAVINDVLGIWETTTAPDGVYELRLTVNVTGQPATFHRVAPLRIENVIPPFLVLATPTPSVGGRVTPTRPALIRPTLVATPTQFAGTPTVTALTNANVRAGDGVIYNAVGFLLVGNSAPILGVSASGSGWYYIQLETGTRGFISPEVVTVSGSTTNLPRVSPPATPTPTFTPTPPTAGNLIMNGHATVPQNPRCGESFEVQINVTNIGRTATNSAITIRLQDQDIATGNITATMTAIVPILRPGDNYVAVFPMLISSFPAADHRMTAFVDANFQVPEENENDNTYVFTYRLRQGVCP